MSSRDLLILIGSFLIGFFLTLLPIIPKLNNFYPIWMMLILFYWMQTKPNTIGLCTAWTCGLILDCLFNNLFGTHALALLILTACFGKFAKRFHFFSGLQQMLLVFLFGLGYLILLNSIKAFSHQPITLNCTPAFTTALFWPFVASLLDYFQPNTYPR